MTNARDMRKQINVNDRHVAVFIFCRENAIIRYTAISPAFLTLSLSLNSL